MNIYGVLFIYFYLTTKKLEPKGVTPCKELVLYTGKVFFYPPFRLNHKPPKQPIDSTHGLRLMQVEFKKNLILHRTFFLAIIIFEAETTALKVYLSFFLIEFWWHANITQPCCKIFLSPLSSTLQSRFLGKFSKIYLLRKILTCFL